MRRHGTSAPLESKKAQKTARRSGAEKQPVLFIWMSVPWWVQTIFSALWDQNQNNKTNKNPPQIPEKQQEGMQEVLTGHTDPGGVVNAARAFNAHPTLSPRPGSPIRVVRLLTDGDIGSRPSRSPCLYVTSRPFPASSRVRVFFLHEGSADPGLGRRGRDSMAPTLRPRSPAARARSLEALIKAAWQSYELKRKGEGKQKQNHPTSVFSRTKGETGMARPPAGTPTVRR